LKKTHHKNRAGGVDQGIGPEFKLQHCKKKKCGEQGGVIELSIVVNMCNLSYSGGIDLEDGSSRPAQAKWPSQQKSWVWWHTPVIPATWEA
jgi:hypothetical protein